MNADPYVVAEALVAAQRWDSARVTLGEALAARPDDPRLLGLLVRTLRAQGQTQAALDAAQQMLALTPRDPYALRLGTLALLDVGWVDEAIGLARLAVEADPGNAANHLALSRAWASSPLPGAVGHQLAAAREAILLEPNSVDAQLQIGTALSADGDAAAARQAYLQALRLDPNNTAALNNLAVLELRGGSLTRAAQQLAAALAVNPQGRSARHNLDSLVVAVARSIGRWTLFAPVPAMVVAALDLAVVARALVVVAVVVSIVPGARWWRSLTAGQRLALGGLTRRLRARVWVWPGLAVSWGLVGLAGVALWPTAITAAQVATYLLVATLLLLTRAALGRRPRRRA